MKIMTTLKQKLLLTFLGAIFSLVIIEGLLHFGGFVFLSIQNYNNRTNIESKNQFRILCIGESLTALGGEDSYPSQLEKLLNAKKNGMTFKVINKGLPATESGFHASQLEKNLNRYKPHIVVAMLGINDEVYAPIIDANVSTPKNSFLQNFRTYTLVKLLKEHFEHKTEDFKANRLRQTLKKKEKEIDESPTSARYLQLAFRYRMFDDWEKSIKTLLKAIELDRTNFLAWGYLGRDYIHLLEFEKAAEAFEEMLKEIPDSSKEHKIFAFDHLAASYMRLKKYKKAEDTYRRLLDYYPQHESAHGAIGEIYLEQKQYPQAEALLMKQITLHPYTTRYYKKLAECYKRRGESQMIIALFSQAIQINPHSAPLHVDFAKYYMDMKKYPEAEEILTKALEINSEEMVEYRHTVIGHLITTYHKQKKTDDALKLRKAYLAKEKDFKLELQNNYQTIKRICYKKGINLLAVQYPMRDTATLKEMLSPTGNVTFVDNKEIFEKAVQREGYLTYFSDHFAGDFGHCTAKGYQLLASNVADSILKLLNHHKNGHLN